MKVCSVCKSQYNDDVMVCPRCNVPLVFKDEEYIQIHDIESGY